MPKHPDYCSAGDVIDIGNIDGLWQRQPDDVRYVYADGTRTQCPICKDDAAGVPWGGWFSCDYMGCCIALVDTGEVFVRVRPDAAAENAHNPAAAEGDGRAVPDAREKAGRPSS